MNVTNVAVTDDVQSCDRKSGAELNVATEPSQIPQPKKKLNQERSVSDNSKDGSVKTTEVTAGPKKMLIVPFSKSNLVQVLGAHFPANAKQTVCHKWNQNQTHIRVQWTVLLKAVEDSGMIMTMIIHWECSRWGTLKQADKADLRRWDRTIVKQIHYFLKSTL